MILTTYSVGGDYSFVDFFPSKVCNSKNITRMSYFLRLSRYKGKMKKVNAILRLRSTSFMNNDTTINQHSSSKFIAESG